MSVAILNRAETLQSLFNGPEAMNILMRGIMHAVHRSFQVGSGSMRMDIPKSEISSRIAACIKWARILRGDYEWGLERIVGQFDEILRCHLAKLEYAVPTRKLWMPEDGA